MQHSQFLPQARQAFLGANTPVNPAALQPKLNPYGAGGAGPNAAAAAYYDIRTSADHRSKRNDWRRLERADNGRGKRRTGTGRELQ